MSESVVTIGAFQPQTVSPLQIHGQFKLRTGRGHRRLILAVWIIWRRARQDHRTLTQ